MESPLKYNPEKGKPEPVSVREYVTMGRREQRAFQALLDRKERRDFVLAVIQSYDRLPLQNRREIMREKVAKLEARKGNGIGDRIELWQAKAYLKRLELPPKKPIFLRKLRSGEMKVPKFLERKSPFLMTSGI